MYIHDHFNYNSKKLENWIYMNILITTCTYSTRLEFSILNSNSNSTKLEILSLNPKLKPDSTQNFEFKTCNDLNLSSELQYFNPVCHSRPCKLFEFLFVVLFYCLLYVRPSNFCSLFKVRLVMGAKIMTSIYYVEKVALTGNRTRALQDRSLLL